jgi:glycosyltransferase involved in cell wall biosynthesis
MQKPGYKLMILITFKDTSTTLGNACRIEMSGYLAKHFDACIITNRKDLIKTYIKDCPVYEFESKPHTWLPIISNILEHKRIARIINKKQHDLVFMFDNTSSATLWLNKAVFQYVHQYGSRTKKVNRNLLRTLVKKTLHSIHDYFYFKGLRNSRYVFVVSKSIIEIMRQHKVKNLGWTPHAMDINKFQNPVFNSQHEILKENRKNGFFIVTYTGWVTENRGFKVMLDSIKESVSKDKHILLVIAGADREFSHRIENYKKQHGLESNIINFGIVDASLIPGILHLSDVCLSFWDAEVDAFRLAPPKKLWNILPPVSLYFAIELKRTNGW